MVAVISTGHLLYWLTAMVTLLVVGTTIGLIWADTSDLAGAFAGVTNIVSIVGIVLILGVLGANLRRQRRRGRR
jgi:hypothetical protein